MYVSSRQEYKPPVKSIGKVKEYSHFASLKYCNGAETFYIVSYHAYIPLLKFNNIVMNKIIKILSSITAVPFRNLPVRIGSAYSNRLTLSREQSC